MLFPGAGVGLAGAEPLSSLVGVSCSIYTKDSGIKDPCHNYV